MPAGSRQSRWGFGGGVWGSTLTKGGLGGGVFGGALHVTFCLTGGQNPRRDVLRLSAAPAPLPGRTTVAPSHLGLNEPQFLASFGAKHDA
jgi:hypothetical protein